jgi:hypothetical protein
MLVTEKKNYAAREMNAVSDNPEWTKADFASAHPSYARYAC